MLERFRPGEPFGVMVPGKGLVIGQAEADRLNAIADALGPTARMGAAGRVRRTPGGLFADPEVPETFHARLDSDTNPYAWVEARRTDDGLGWEDVPGGRNSDDDGEAAEYNSTAGLEDRVVLMQRWPGGFHRFVRSGLGEGGPPPGPAPCCLVPWHGRTVTITSAYGTFSKAFTRFEFAACRGVICVARDGRYPCTVPTTGDWPVDHVFRYACVGPNGVPWASLLLLGKTCIDPPFTGSYYRHLNTPGAVCVPGQADVVNIGGWTSLLYDSMDLHDDMIPVCNDYPITFEFDLANSGSFHLGTPFAANVEAPGLEPSSMATVTIS